MPKQIWVGVRLVTDHPMGAGYSVDVPRDNGLPRYRHRTLSPIISDLIAGDGRPLVNAVQIEVADEDADKFTQVTPDARTLAILGLFRASRREGRLDEAALDGNLRAMGGSKALVKEALLQAVARGMHPVRAQAIVADKALPSAQHGAGVDREVLETSAGYVRRALRLQDPADAAEIVVAEVREKMGKQ